MRFLFIFIYLCYRLRSNVWIRELGLGTINHPNGNCKGKPGEGLSDLGLINTSRESGLPVV